MFTDFHFFYLISFSHSHAKALSGSSFRFNSVAVVRILLSTLNEKLFDGISSALLSVSIGS